MTSFTDIQHKCSQSHPLVPREELGESNETKVGGWRSNLRQINNNSLRCPKCNNRVFFFQIRAGVFKKITKNFRIQLSQIFLEENIIQAFMSRSLLLSSAFLPVTSCSSHNSTYCHISRMQSTRGEDSRIIHRLVTLHP